MESLNFMQSNYTDNYNAIQLSLPLDLGIKINPVDEVVSFLKALKGVNLKKYLKRDERRGKNYIDNIKMFIGRIFQYGYTGKVSLNWRSQNASDADKLSEAIATQLLVWETVVGERDENFGKVDSGSYDAVLDSIKPAHPLRSKIMAHYNRIVESVQKHSKLPNFCDTKLEEEKNSVSYDVLEMSGSRAVWKEVLAVYSVKVNTDPDNPQEVATMDESKKQLLKDIFWEMNEISSRTDTKTESVIEETDDGHGNIVETETAVTQTYLYITVSHKTADDMAVQYGFSEEQKGYLAELLADENNSLWSQVLYGITGTDDQIVNVALSQIGNMGGDPYWSWYGFNSRVEWCACFVSWCANECGYIDAGVIPKYAGCVNGVQWFKDRGQWLDNSAEPTPGMIIFFDWASSGQDGLSDHTGIVQKVENGRVYTIEGNSGDSVRQNSYPIGYYEILGYGAPAY